MSIKLFNVKIKLFAILFFSALSNIGFTQFTVNVKTFRQPFYASDGDTLSLCIDSIISLKATALNGTDTLKTSKFTWDFDDLQTLSGIKLDSVTHKYTKGGGYRIKLFVREGNAEIMKIIPVHVSQKPDFKDTKNVLPDGQTGICKGGKAALSGKAHALKWKDKPVYKTTFNPQKEISNTKIDTFRFFSMNLCQQKFFQTAI